MRHTVLTALYILAIMICAWLFFAGPVFIDKMTDFKADERDMQMLLTIPAMLASIVGLGLFVWLLMEELVYGDR